MTYAGKKYTMNVCQGPLLKEILLFTWPLFCSTLLQLTYTLADHVVVGRFASPLALAAVGATQPVTSLLVNLFLGIAIGSNVISAHFYGAGDQENLKQSVRTAMALSIIGGIIVGLSGLLFSRQLLQFINTPDKIIDKSALYLKIYFTGMPFIMIYNFGSAVLRAVGDTRRALYYLTASGILNVLLNLFFVICCGMDADGVAYATVISQILASVLVWHAIATTEELGGLSFRQIRLNPKMCKKILAIGLPAGFQSVSFCLANIFLQASINTFQELAIAGNTAALQIETLVNTGSSCFHNAAISFAGQLYGARMFARLKRFIFECLVLAEIIIMGTAMLALYFGPQLLALFTEDPEVIDWGMQRMNAILIYYFTHGVMQVCSGTMRGMGKSFVAFLIVLVCACLFRIAWIIFVFPHFHTLGGLLFCFPVSWLLVAIVSSIYLWWLFRRKAAESLEGQLPNA